MPSGTRIELDEFTCEFGGPRKVVALDRLSLVIGDGSFVAVTGPSGSGKTTLLNVLGLLGQPTSGRYMINSVDTSQLSKGELGRLRAGTIGFVFQSFHLISSRNVIDNVALAGRYQGLSVEDSYQEASVVLRRLGMGHRLTAMPPTLSGGESQRVAIARGVMGDRSLLLCDEPTGNLDHENSTAIVELLAELNQQGMTVITVTHDLELAARFATQVQLRDGVVMT
ncbi:MAG: ABC transporter ATP-binding protein [Acidimicrobiia bacterium]